MDVVLTSFGMGMKGHGRGTMFYRMPPLFFGEHNGGRRFHIDYACLFMFDRVIVDERSFEKALACDLAGDDSDRMSPSMLEAVKQGAAEYAEVLSELQASDRLVIKDFDAIMAKSRDLVDKATAADMKDMLRWSGPLESAVIEWSRVNDRLCDGLGSAHWDDPPLVIDKQEFDALRAVAHNLGGIAGFADHIVYVLKQWKKKQSPEMRKKCRELLRDYLSYANTNLILSFACQAPFIDWMDIRHLYEEKFRVAEQSDEGTSQMGQQAVATSRRLFDFLFPYFIPKSPTELVRAVNDSRADRLRRFVRDAAEKGVDFDPRECIDILKDILRLEYKAVLRRKITGWATLPLGFIPVIGTPIQKGVEELVNALWSNSPIQEYSWFYLINELDVSADAAAEARVRRAEPASGADG